MICPVSLLSEARLICVEGNEPAKKLPGIKAIRAKSTGERTIESKGRSEMNATATKDIVSTPDSEAAWLLPIVEYHESKTAPKPRLRPVFAWALIAVSAVVAIFGGASWLFEDQAVHHNLPPIVKSK
jgi:hypothetical protein